ncbi:hypothetical protein HJB84_17670 [Rhizobium sp. NZLR1b]|uniref:hypothetical protein n=1 Tax=Rhizobium sp. NZLR1b TaxID=2731099 RepID=UPI001C83C38A|nr:hypothetical protein [Rhizobium sp. NZLR1b]MBX5171668.1 hypothetical protein [Rhizobium sp. NZLR1b]
MRHQGPASNGSKSIRNVSKLQQRIPQDKSIKPLSDQFVGGLLQAWMPVMATVKNLTLDGTEQSRRMIFIGVTPKCARCVRRTSSVCWSEPIGAAIV